MDSSVYVTGIFAILLCTAFVKIATVLTIVRVGLGLDGMAFGVVVLALTAALSLVAMSPELKAVGGVDAFLSGSGPGRFSEFSGQLTPFLDRHTEPGMVERLRTALAPGEGGKPSDPAAPAVDPGALRIAAFLLSELKAAFELGLIILVPLLVIDLVVVNLLMVLGVTQLSHVVVALPLKLLLFFALDGWGLIAAKVLRGYAVTGG